VTEKVALGISLKMLGIYAPGYSQVGDPAYSGGRNYFSYDIGYFQQATKWLNLSAKVENVNAPVIKLLDSSSGEKMKTLGKAGIAFKPGALTIAIDVDDVTDAAASYTAGGEVVFSDFFAVRLGCNRGNFTSGFGFKVGKISADFGFLFHDRLGTLCKTGINIEL
jgi:hypothetical protein